MKKLLSGILICLSFSGGLFAATSDSLVSRDTLSKNPGLFRQDISEIEITFDASKLAPQNVRIIFNELFKQYLTIKDALVYNDSYNATRNTLKLLDDMRTKTKDIDILNKDDRWVFFLKNFDDVKKKAESTTFISEQRFLFNEVTNGIADFIKQYGLSDKTIYMMQCTDGSISGNGKWLSGARDKKNPYLGMINDTTCTKVKEVWKF